MRSLGFIVLFSCVAFIIAQKQARIGPDGKPLLNRPTIEECQKRKSHLKWNGHHYFMSWAEPWHKFEDWDWFNGRNFCRDRCMDLVSFETPEEFGLISAIMRKENVSSVYTSGRKCNFKGKGCDAEHLQPINVNGWFWAGASNKRIPATNVPSTEAFWSPVGDAGRAQPDNHEGIENGPLNVDDDIGLTIDGLQEYHDEACLAVMNNKFGEGVAWHDVACHFRSVIVCEDSDQLINLVKTQNNVDVTDTVEEGARQYDINTIDTTIVPIRDPRVPVQQPQQQQPQRRPNFSGRPGGFFPGFRRPQTPEANRPKRRPTSGFLGNLRQRFNFLF